MRRNEGSGPGDEFGDSMDDDEHDGNLPEALRRLRAANLLPPIKGLHAVECIEITTSAPLTAELRAQISQVLGGIRHHVIQAPRSHGVDYR